MASHGNDDASQATAITFPTPLQELSQLPEPETCVICLELVSEKCLALPCRHDHFDFLCLGTWLEQHPRCPLCKTGVRAIQYIVKDRDTAVVLDVERANSSQTQHSAVAVRHGTAPSRTQHLSRIRGLLPKEPKADDAGLAFRRTVYQKKMYSLHVGSNRVSGYRRNLVPESFVESPELVSRATIFVRRELAVFNFLNRRPTSSSRLMNNAEFLLQYIIAILRSIDIRGSSGQAEELLKDFLGGENAKLFLHELEAWLRSPFEKLADWDRTVQYREISIAKSTLEEEVNIHRKRNSGGTVDHNPPELG